MSGKKLKLEKLFNKEENAVIIAVDHGMFAGPISGLGNVKETLKKINPMVDGVLMSAGTLRDNREFFNFKGAPMPIVRINWADVYCFPWKYNTGATVWARTVEEVAALGAEIVLISVTLGTGNPAIDTNNVEIFCKMARIADQMGIPVIGEYFPAHSDSISADDMHEKVKISCRILSELGADMIKTFHTNKFREVTEGTQIPVFGLGADKTSQLNALKLAEREIIEGAKGVVFGRNAFQVNDPLHFQSALLDVVKRNISPEEAVKKYQLKD